MRKLAKIESKIKSIDALVALYKSVYRSDDVYIIDRDAESSTPGVVLWMSSFDYQKLVILGNGSRVSVHEVEENTKRYRERKEYPAGTEKYKYVSVG